jgi:hypothetical protein
LPGVAHAPLPRIGSAVPWSGDAAESGGAFEDGDLPLSVLTDNAFGHRVEEIHDFGLDRLDLLPNLIQLGGMTAEPRAPAPFDP